MTPIEMPMIKTLKLGGYAALASVIASPVLGEAQGDDPIELWDGLTTATTKAEVKAYRASLANKRSEVIEGCLAPFAYRTKKGGLVTVLFAAQDKDANCHARLLEKYMARLGEPEVKGTTFGSVIGNGMGGSLDTTSEGVMLIWREGEKKTKLVKTPGNGYNLIFTVRPDKYIY